jgi:phosphatidylserine/phosphatidylglycerophosphate/cardiolipin synthase-like enzyme
MTEKLSVAAYSFTSSPVVKALIAAKKRGVDVRVVADEKEIKGKRASQPSTCW